MEERRHTSAFGRVGQALFWGLVLAACVGVWFTGEERRWGLSREAGDILQRAAAPYRMDEEVAGGWRWLHLRIERYEARFELARGEQRVSFWLLHPDGPQRHPGRRQAGEEIDLVVPAAGEPGAGAVEAMAARLCAFDDAPGLWHDADPRGPDDPRRFTRPVAQILQVFWILLFALVARFVVRWARPWDRQRQRDLLLFAALALGAFLVRWLGASWGPGDLQFNLYAAFSERAAGELMYGEAPDSLVRLAFFFFAPRTLATAIGVNLVVGALAVVVGAAFVRTWLGRGFAPWLAGLLFALQPVLVRNAGEANRQAVVLFAGLLALAGLAHFLSRAPRGRTSGLLIYGLAASLVLRARPEALALLPLVGLLLLAAQPLAAWRRRETWARVGWVALVSLVPLFALVGPVFVEGAKHLLVSSQGSGFLDPAAWLRAFTEADSWRYFAFAQPRIVPAAFVAFIPVGLLFALIDRDRRAAWGGVAFVACASAYLVHCCNTSLSCGSDSRDFWLNARYQTLLFAPATLSAVYGISRLHRTARERSGSVGGWAAAVLIGAALVGSSVGALRDAFVDRLLDREYAFILETAKTLPAGAWVHVVWIHEDIGLKNLPREIPPLVGWRQEWRPWEREPRMEGDAPHFYYHTATCAAEETPPELRQACEEALYRYGNRPVREQALPSAGIGRASYDQPFVTVGFYEMSPEAP